MTPLVNEITINSDPVTVSQFVARVERWAEILPHYRYVSRVDSIGADQRYVMSAWRDSIPVRWEALVSWEPEVPRLRFRHLAGFTRGMNVEWTFVPLPGKGETLVTILHDMSDIRGFRRMAIDRFVAAFFIDFIANRTLACMKARIEEP